MNFLNPPMHYRLVLHQHIGRNRTSRGHNDRFLHKVVIQEEPNDWNVWLQENKPKPWVQFDLRSKNVLFCVWWESKAWFIGSCFPQTRPDRGIYLTKLRPAYSRGKPNKRNHVILLHGNGRLQTVNIVRTTRYDFKLEALLHLPYSLDLPRILLYGFLLFPFTEQL